jgi:hypothetical protein
MVRNKKRRGSMSESKAAEKNGVFELIASGETVQSIAERMEISLQTVKRWCCRYFDMAPADRLRAIMRPDLVGNRMHRLMDDLKDIERIDAAVKCTTDEKTLAALLDVKRKIRERMMKDTADIPEGSTNGISPELQKEIDQYYREIVGEEPPKRYVPGANPRQALDY